MMNNTNNNNNNNDTNHSEVSSTSYCADVESSQHERHPAHGSKQQEFVPIRGYNDSDHMDHDDDDDDDHEECYSCQGIVLESQEIMPNTPLQNHETINYYEPQRGNDDGEEGYVSSSEKTPILSNHANSSLHEYLSMNSSLSMEELHLLNDYKQNDNNDINNGKNMGMDGNRTISGGDLDCPPSKHPMHPLGNKQPKKTRGTGTATSTRTSTATTTTSSGRVRKYIPKLMRRSKSISEKVLDHKGRRQPTLCRDTAFAILYLAQLIVVICAGLRFGPDASGEDGNHDNSSQKTVVSIDEFGMPVKETSVESVQGIEFDYKNTLLVTLATGVASMGLSLAVMSFMAVFTKHLVHMALFLAISLSIVWTIVGLIRTDQSFVPLTGVFALGASIVYTFMVWEKIPFVYANLFTALEAIRDTFAIVALAIVMQIVALIWIIFYFFTIIGTYDYFQRDDGDHHLKSWNVAAYVGLGISFYWTIQALSHIIQVCIAGYIQRWWFSSRLDHSEKLDVIGESLIRALVYSLGSVCFGSLFIGFVNFLRSIADHIRPNTEEAPLRALVAVQEFLVSCIDYVALIFHNFAMVYVGMYGYDYLKAADRANILFFKRGWQDIVEHSLLSNLLWVISLMIAGLCGCISMEIEHVWKFSLVSVDEPITLSFCIGFFVGFILSNILFSVIRSSVNTVVVCFAGSPTEFQTFHPECSQIMRKAWKESWPGFVDFVEKDNVVLGPRSPSRRNLRRNLHI